MKTFKKIALSVALLLLIFALVSCIEDIDDEKIIEPDFDSCSEGNHSIDLWVEDGEYVSIYCSECNELIHKGKPNYDLAFFLNSETNEYYVSSANKAAQNEVIIVPATYNGLPVTGVESLYPEYNTGVSFDFELTLEESQIKTVYIPSSVKYIGSLSLNDKLENVYLSSGVEEIEKNAFSNCDSLKNIYVSLSNPSFKVKAGALYTKDGSKLIKYCSQNSAVSFKALDGVKEICDEAFRGALHLKNITLPDSLVHIGSGAFSGCISLDSIAIPNSVQAIDGGAFRECSSLKSASIGRGASEIGRLAFYGCTSLENISVDLNNTSYLSYEGHLYNKSGTLLIQYALGSREKVFSGRPTLTTIGEFAFAGAPYLEEVEKIHILQYINQYAFNDCPSLKVITFGSSLQKIEEKAFGGCTAIEEVHISSLFGWLNVKLEGLYSSPFCDNADLYVMGELITYLYIPSSISNIPESIFWGCQSIKAVIVPKTVRKIGKAAFFGCKSLEEVVLEDGVKSIYGSAFYGCSSLREIIIPDSVTYIDNFAFSDCISLESIVLPNQLRAINNSLFDGCTSLKSVTVPISVKEIGFNAFLYCESLEEINYAGSTEDWEAIDKSSYYNHGCNAFTVNCTDEAIEIPKWE